ncbi:gap junction alpha-9 protein [Sorex araneus]|uniref:gap junction alpha-9 protein n=1 Tax=Sorex araneus TaxID=42254 RepID=UPI002433641C|nr:gap junction alpha-9 protein [Sorex araneus]
MGNWNFLGGILEEVHIHSTTIGKIWLTILFIFRMLVLGVAAEDVWNDEQTGFLCNTEQPGCRNVCYDQAFPISLIRYWVLQVIFVSSPSLVYMGHALYRLSILEKERQRKKARIRAELEGGKFETPGEERKLGQEICLLREEKLNKAPLRGTLLCTYVIHIFTLSVVEVGFMVGQYLLYGFHLRPLFRCHGYPCPNIIDCFISRPTEKTVFLLFMQSIAAASLFLNVLEIFYLGLKKIKRGLWGQYKLKDGHNKFYLNKSKQISAKYSTHASSLKQLSYVSDYGQLMEIQTHTAISTSLNLPAFQPDSDKHSATGKKCIMKEQETVVFNERCTFSTNLSQHTDSSNKDSTHKMFGIEGNEFRRKRAVDGNDNKRRHYTRGYWSMSAVPRDLDKPLMQSSQTVFSLPPQCTWKPEWLPASTEHENQVSPPKDNAKGQFREGMFGALPPSQVHFQPLDIPETPNSLRELSFEPQLVRTCRDSTANLPNHLALLTKNHIGRRAPSDLQI